MRIERVTRRNNLPYLTCGCLAVFVGCLVVVGAAALLLLPRLPDVGLQIAGFQARGSTDSLFVDAPAQPTEVIENASQPQQALVELGQYGEQTLNPQVYDYTLTVGRSPAGGEIAVLTFTETSLMALCQQRTTVCGTSGSTYRNGRIELRPGGAVIYADVYVPQVGSWLPLGAVMQLDSSQRQFGVVGVDFNGTLYQAPPTELGRVITDIEQTGNDILRQLILEAEGERYHLSEMRIDDTTLTLVLRT